MRHNTMNEHETPLASGTMGDCTSCSDLTPEALDSLILKARQMRAEATTRLLSRLGAAMVGSFRGRTLPKLTGTASAVNGGPQRAV